MNWQSAVGNVDDDQDNEMFYVNVSIPLGGSQSISSYMRKQGDSTTYGVSNSGSLGDNTHYYISADRDQDTKDNSFNGNINTNLHYTQLSVGAEPVVIISGTTVRHCRAAWPCIKRA